MAAQYVGDRMSAAATAHSKTALIDMFEIFASSLAVCKVIYLIHLHVSDNGGPLSTGRLSCQFVSMYLRHLYHSGYPSEP